MTADTYLGAWYIGTRTRSLRTPSSTLYPCPMYSDVLVGTCLGTYTIWESQGDQNK